MCWLMAFVRGSGGRTGKAPKALADVVSANLPRGNHAWGFASIDSNGRLSSFKEPGTVDAKILTEVARRSKILIVHGRWATHGAARDNHNNHPHSADGGWIAHNGIIGGHEYLAKQHDLLLQTECDSEVLARLIENADGSLSERVRYAIEQTSRWDALAMLGLWRESAPTLICARRGNPLHTWHDGRFTWFSTLAPASAKDAKLLGDNTVYKCTMSGAITSALPIRKQYEEFTSKWKGGSVKRDPSGAIVVGGTESATSTRPPLEWGKEDEWGGASYEGTAYNYDTKKMKYVPAVGKADTSKLPAKYKRDLPQDWMNEKVGSAERSKRYGNRGRKRPPIAPVVIPAIEVSQTVPIASDSDDETFTIQEAVETGMMTPEEGEECRKRLQKEDLNQLTDDETEILADVLNCSKTVLPQVMDEMADEVAFSKAPVIETSNREVN